MIDATAQHNVDPTREAECEWSAWKDISGGPVDGGQWPALRSATPAFTVSFGRIDRHAKKTARLPRWPTLCPACTMVSSGAWLLSQPLCDGSGPRPEVVLNLPCCIHVAWSFRQTFENTWKFLQHDAT